VLDVSDVALDEARARVGPDDRVQWIDRDLMTWQPTRRYNVWHESAVFHFMVSEDERRKYRGVLARALAPEATVIVGTFAADGPTLLWVVGGSL
jgi:trans-aconitate methyltransferase